MIEGSSSLASSFAPAQTWPSRSNTWSSKVAVVGDILNTLASHVVRQGETLDTLRQVAEAAVREKAIADASDKRSEAMRAAEQNLALQAHYDAEVFDSYGERAPAPVAGADPMDYKFNLMKAVRQKLSRADDRSIDGGPTTVGTLAGLKFGGMSDEVLNALEPQLLQAAALQAAKPHPSSLPPEGFVARHVVDDETGRRKTEWHGRRSFIADMGRPGRRILRLQDPVNHRVLYGPGYPQMPDH
jgi:hypothetical protein